MFNCDCNRAFPVKNKGSVSLPRTALKGLQRKLSVDAAYVNCRQGWTGDVKIIIVDLWQGLDVFINPI